MYARILVCLDGNMDIDEHILDHVAGLAKALDSEVLLLRVAHYHTRDSRTAEQAEAKEYSEVARDYLAQRGVTKVRSIEASGEPSKTIIRVANENDAELIAMSTHGHGFVFDIFLGSVSDEVRHQTPIPVLLVRHP
jgi:nucleotide-binding universal stress UspA family protein